jgi:predicted Zn-dependent protease
MWMSMTLAALLWSLLSGAHAADMLEETRGVVGRDMVLPSETAWAEALIDSGQWDKALIAWQGLALINKDPDAAMWAIVCAVRAGDPEAAQAATFMAMDIAEGDPRVLLTAAWLLNEGGAHREAAKLVQDYPEAAPDAEGADHADAGLDDGGQDPQVPAPAPPDDAGQPAGRVVLV